MRLVSTALAAAGFLGFAGAAQADCRTAPFRFNPVTNDTIEAYSRTDGRGCGYGFHMGGRDAIKRIRITVKPQHGRIGGRGTSFGYLPAPGFVGKDRFTAQICARRITTPGCSTINFNITVNR